MTQGNMLCVMSTSIFATEFTTRLGQYQSVTPQAYATHRMLSPSESKAIDTCRAVVRPFSPTHAHPAVHPVSDNVDVDVSMESMPAEGPAERAKVLMNRSASAIRWSSTGEATVPGEGGVGGKDAAVLEGDEDEDFFGDESMIEVEGQDEGDEATGGQDGGTGKGNASERRRVPSAVGEASTELAMMSMDTADERRGIATGHAGRQRSISELGPPGAETATGPQGMRAGAGNLPRQSEVPPPIQLARRQSRASVRSHGRRTQRNGLAPSLTRSHGTLAGLGISDRTYGTLSQAATTQRLMTADPAGRKSLPSLQLTGSTWSPRRGLFGGPGGESQLGGLMGSPTGSGLRLSYQPMPLSGRKAVKWDHVRLTSGSLMSAAEAHTFQHSGIHVLIVSGSSRTELEVAEPLEQKEFQISLVRTIEDALQVCTGVYDVRYAVPWSPTLEMGFHDTASNTIFVFHRIMAVHFHDMNSCYLLCFTLCQTLVQHYQCCTYHVYRRFNIAPPANRWISC